MSPAIGDVEILDRGDRRSIRYLGRLVSVPFIGGPGDGMTRTYQAPAPRSTRAYRDRYVLSTQGGKLFYAHALSIGFFLERDDFFTHVADICREAA
jgi:hypothetical protein